MAVATERETVTLTIDGLEVAASEGATILDVALAAGIDVPRLCFDPRLKPVGACRLCIVDIEGVPGLPTACNTAATDGMVVHTETDELAGMRKDLLEIILGDHKVICPSCDKNGDCALMDYSYRYQADQFAYGVYQPGPIVPNFATGNEAIAFDPQLCITCGRCVRICDEVIMASALTITQRASKSEVTTPFDMPLNETSCVLCGMCISTCPTGAMYERAALGQGQCKDLEKVRSVCPYCGVGCVIELNVNRDTNRIVRVTSPIGCVPNDGNLCVKGKFGFEFVHSPERLTTPLIKENGAFREASWDEALELAGRKLREIRDEHGPDSIAFLSSCRCTNEENYLMQKVARTAGATNNIDQCATTCHAPTVAGLASSFGSGAMTNSIGEIKDVDTLFIIGSNPTEAHPIIGLEMKKALQDGAKLVVCDPRRTWVAEHADIHIQHRPGTDNMLINAMMRHIVDSGLHDAEFVEARTEHFAAFAENLRGFSVETAAEVCDVEADLIRRAAEMYALGDPSAIFYTLGITEHTTGTENVQNLANLAMLCGQIGKASSGVNPLRGQNNVQGGCDMGAMHGDFPGYQKVTNEAVRLKFGEAWDVEIPTNEGGRIPDFIEQAGEGTLRGFYVFGEDPVLSEPNQAKVIESLERLEFLVCQEIFMSETAKLADVVLPATSFAEKDGTFTNTERRVQRVRKAVDPPGEAKPDWEILCLMSTAMGHPLSYRDAGEIFDEMAGLTPSYGGMSFERIDEVGLQWPCPTPDHAGTKFLHEGSFTRGLGAFQVIDYREAAELPDAEYPYVLSTGRTLYNYNIGNMTQKASAIRQKQRRSFVEMHERDAAELGVADGDYVVVATRRGEVTVRAKVGQRTRPGALWMPFHFVDQPANRITNDAFDPVTRTAEYKVCAARLAPATATASVDA
ncbi:MAG TPA: formate dehydrogenase subunit alpha [Acidimicrobiia bacterium]|jgi:formate dehydrogenase alpha subunit|nr:formate dehydrogenase subunit alpha [Acidimicrobiia bacterium]